MIKEQVKSLWKLCFDDSEAFIELYFRLRYNNEVNLAIQSGEEVIAALQMLPYPMTFCNKIVPTSYISGACTHPDYRAKGVMRELLSQSFARMLRNGVLFSTLIPAEPWLFGYYAKTGYTPAFRISHKVFSLSELTISPEPDTMIEETTEYQEDYYQYLTGKLSERACCLQHTPTDFKVVLADLALTQNTVLIARKDNRVTGIAVVYKHDDSSYINELFADNEAVRAQLLYRAGLRNGTERIILQLPPVESLPSVPLGMARIIDARAVLQLYAAGCPEVEMNIELTDEQLSVNNGYYYLCKGKCMTSEVRLPGVHTRMTIAELSEKILDEMQPYMSLMMN